MDGEIKLTLDFLHAAVLASNADPKIRQYLEPDGMTLSFDHPATPDKAGIEAECLDDLPVVAAYHQSLMNPAAGEPDIKRAMDAAIAELRQNYNVWAAKQGKGNNHVLEN